MKRLYVIAAGLLAACNPPVSDAPGAFEGLMVERVQPAHCIFTAPDSTDTDQALFITRKDDPADMAYVRFKGETLKLVPETVPDFSGEALDVTYDVLDYLDWKVRVTAVRGDDGVYSGTLSLRNLGASAPFTGRCDG